ncbi:MAG TPA: hypothetical protein DCP92_11550 [Nitrospiraceae bacterium]|nr:hypothetical protein [Nitrospiraceae bacterium]
MFDNLFRFFFVDESAHEVVHVVFGVVAEHKTGFQRLAAALAEQPALPSADTRRNGYNFLLVNDLQNVLIGSNRPFRNQFPIDGYGPHDGGLMALNRPAKTFFSVIFHVLCQLRVDGVKLEIPNSGHERQCTVATSLAFSQSEKQPLLRHTLHEFSRLRRVAIQSFRNVFGSL